MNPEVFFGAFLSALLSAIPAHAGVVCDRRGFCVEQPQFVRPYYPPAPVYIPPPRYQDPPSPPQHDALGDKTKAEIYEFCGRHPEEQFCNTLNQYLDKHPNAR